MVRHQPSKLIFAGSNPVSRSFLFLRMQSWPGLVAQRLAQATHNRLVAGSNPAGPTFLFKFPVLMKDDVDRSMTIQKLPSCVVGVSRGDRMFRLRQRIQRVVLEIDLEAQ